MGSSAVANLNAGTSFTGTGTLRTSGTGIANVNAALALPATVTFDVAGGTVNAVGVLTAPTMTWSAGTLTGKGGFVASGTLGITGPAGGCANCNYWLYLVGTTLTNNGVVTQGAGLGTGGRYQASIFPMVRRSTMRVSGTSITQTYLTTVLPQASLQ